MQVKCEVFSRFGNSVDFSSGEPLGGVEASTVGADLCVRPQNRLRSGEDGRTHRSAPTEGDVSLNFVPLRGRGVGRPLIYSYCIGLPVMLLNLLIT